MRGSTPARWQALSVALCPSGDRCASERPTRASTYTARVHVVGHKPCVVSAQAVPALPGDPQMPAPTMLHVINSSCHEQYQSHIVSCADYQRVGKLMV